MRRLRYRPTWSALFGAVFFCSLACVEDQPISEARSVRIGALLPFSGDLAASGINLERSLIMAAEAINSAGGIDGRPVSVLAVDSNRYFPDPLEGFDTHQETLRAFLTGDKSHPLVGADDRIIENAGVDAIVGPLIPELSVRLAAETRRNRVVHMTANVAPESRVEGKCSFSLFPTFGVLGRALGLKMREDGVNTAGIVYLADDYGAKLQARVDLAFTLEGGTILAKSPTETGRASYVADIDNALAGDPDALVLVAPPRLASRIATQALAAERSRDRVGPGAASPLAWYFAPLLRVADFPNNVPPGLVEGGLGIAPGVDEARSAEFSAVFEERWDAEPTLDAHYLFDTMAVLLMALRATGEAHPAVNLTEPESFAASCENVRTVTSTGAAVTWRDVVDGSAFDRVGADLDYEGLTGPVQLDPLGNSGDGLVETWRVSESSDAVIETVSVDSVRSILEP